MKKNIPFHHQHSTLSNGLNVVSIPMKNRLSVALGIWVKVGGRYENSKTSGASHFLEHLVFKGTKKRTAKTIKESIEGVGGSLNAFTSEECTCFLAKAPSRHLKAVFETLADMVCDASLTKNDFEKERKVILEEIKMTQDQPGQLVDEHLGEILWPNHPLGMPIAGTAASVSAFTVDDVIKHRDTHYTAANISVIAAGDIDHESVVRLSKAAFSKFKSKSPNTDFEVFTKQAQKSGSFKLYHKTTEQTHIALGFPSLPKDHPEEYALDILSILMGGNMSSRLFNEVREERGLAYDIGSSLRKYKETGAFVVSLGVDHKKAHKTVDVVLDEFVKISTKKVSDSELRRTKDYYIGQFELSLENPMNCMLWAGDNVLSQNNVKNPQKVYKKIQAVTTSELQSVAKQILIPSKLHLSVVGPQNHSALDKSFKRWIS